MAFTFGKLFFAFSSPFVAAIDSQAVVKDQMPAQRSEEASDQNKFHLIRLM